MRKLKNWIQSYMKYSSYSESPDKFHFWTAVGTIAGALQRHVWIECGYWQWVPNFYIIFVAPPGIVAKSTTMGIGVNLLRKVPKVNFGPDACTWQVLVQELAKSGQVFTDPNTSKFEKQSAMTICAGELGTFLDPKNGEMVDALVSLWDGQKGPWRKATKTQGNDEIINPWINMMGCTTPAWISGSFPDYMIGGGFTSRTVFVYADKKRQFVAYPHLTMKPDQGQLEEDLIHDLCEINKMAGEMRLTEDAIALGEAWYHDFHTKRPSHLDNDQFEGYIARKQTHIHKLAIILSAVRDDDLWITPEDLEQAIAITTTLESDMPKVFGKIGQSQSGKHTQFIRRLLYTHGKIEQTQLYNLCFKTMTVKEYEDSVKSLVKAGKCQLKQEAGKVYIVPIVSEKQSPQK